MVPCLIREGLQPFGPARNRSVAQLFDQVRRQRCFDILIAMPIEREFEVQDVWTKTVGLSDQHGLSVYDAAYLEVAMRRSLPLATLDKELRRAAIAESLTVLP